MAKNKVTIDIEVNGKMQKATVGVNKLKKALKGAEQQQQKYNASSRDGYRAQQGVAQNTSNSTKAFAKQAGQVRGIVPIYATFAANVFAITAAFGALRRAAAVEQLTASLERLGTIAGRNLPALANDLRDITNSAISTEQALRATSVAVSAGFSSNQLKDLTKVAKGASLALGRDMGDALDRLVRGTAKLEPEILDELGILVRLDDATREYAAALGTTADKLSQFQRQQAFLNATITQGISKYDQIEKAINPNAYDQLAASFDNLTKTLINFANVAIVPVVKFFSNNEFALSGALVLFGSTLVKQVVPAIDEVIRRQQMLGSVALQMSRKEGKRIATVYQKGFKAVAKTATDLGDKLPKAAAALIPKLKEGSLGLKEQANLNRSLGVAITARTKAASKASDAVQKDLRGEIALLKQLKLEIAGVETATTQRFIASSKGARLQGQSRLRKRAGAYGEKVDQAGALAGFGVAARGARKQFGEIDKAARKGAKGFQLFRVGVTAATTSLGLFGRAFLNLIPFIGQALFLFSLLSPLISKVFGKGIEGKALDEATEKLSKLSTTSAYLTNRFGENTESFNALVASFKAASGVFDTLSSSFTDIGSALDDARVKELAENFEKLAEAQARLDGKSGGFTATDIALAIGAGGGLQSGQAANLGNDLAQEEVDRLNNQLDITKEKLNKISLASAQALAKVFEAQTAGLSAFVDMEKRAGEVNKLITDNTVTINGEEFVDYVKVAQGISKISTNYAELDQNIKGASSQLSRFNTEVNKITEKASTPFSNVIKQSEEVGKSFAAAFAAIRKEKGTDFEIDLSSDEVNKEFPVIKQRIALLTEALGLQKGAIKTAKDLEDEEIRYNTALEEANDILRDKVAIVKTQETALKKMAALQNVSKAAQEVIFEQEEKVLDAKILVLESQKKLNTLVGGEEKVKGRNLAIDKEIATLRDSQKTQAMQTLEIANAQIAAEQRQLDLYQRQVALGAQEISQQERRNKLANSRTARQERNNSPFAFLGEEERAAKRELKQAQDMRALREQQIEDEEAAKLAQVEIEYKLLDAKYEYLAAELRTTGFKAVQEAASAKLDTDGDGKVSSGEQSAYDSALKAAQETRKRLDITADGLDTARDSLDEFKSRARTLIEDDAILKVEELGESILTLQDKVEAFSTESMIADAAARTFADEFGSAFSSVLEGAKSVKDAFGDLATSILKSIQKVIFDKITQKFVNFLFGDPESGEGGFFGKSKSSAAASTASTAATAGTAGSASAGGPTGVLGSSAMNPMYVCIVACPDGAMAAIGSPAATGNTGPAAAQPGTPTGPNEVTPEQQEESKQGLIDGLKSLDTTTLATASAVTGLAAGVLGNTKAGQALAKVTMALQLVTLAKTVFDKFMKPAQVTAEVSNTAALLALTSAVVANTVAQYSSGLFGRTGGVFSEGTKMSGYSEGGIASGRQAGYPVTLHGTEAVVPLPNGRSIPVEMSGSGGGGMQENNVSVNVVMNNDGNTQSDSKQDNQEIARFGKNIASAVQEEIKKQKRSGGMLSPYGVA